MVSCHFTDISFLVTIISVSNMRKYIPWILFFTPKILGFFGIITLKLLPPISTFSPLPHPSICFSISLPFSTLFFTAYVMCFLQWGRLISIYLFQEHCWIMGERQGGGDTIHESSPEVQKAESPHFHHYWHFGPEISRLWGLSYALSVVYQHFHENSSAAVCPCPRCVHQKCLQT